MRVSVVLLLAAYAAVPALRAQDFRPPDSAAGRRTADSSTAPASAESSAFRFGILGFSTRAGGQVTQDGQAVLGTTIDLVQLGSPRVRLRPSVEVGFGRPEKSLGANVEILFRFQPETAPAIPYIGAGVGYYDDGSIEHVWPTFVLGFELPFRHNVRWLVEYHALDGLRLSRFLVGLAASTGTP